MSLVQIFAIMPLLVGSVSAVDCSITKCSEEHEDETNLLQVKSTVESGIERSEKAATEETQPQFPQFPQGMYPQQFPQFGPAQPMQMASGPQGMHAQQFPQFGPAQPVEMAANPYSDALSGNSQWANNGAANADATWQYYMNQHAQEQAAQQQKYAGQAAAYQAAQQQKMAQYAKWGQSQPLAGVNPNNPMGWKPSNVPGDSQPCSQSCALRQAPALCHYLCNGYAYQR